MTTGFVDATDTIPTEPSPRSEYDLATASDTMRFDNEPAQEPDPSLPKDPIGWLRKAMEKLEAFRELPDNWDGYGGQRLDDQVYLRVRKFLARFGNWILPEPDIFPGSGGGVQFEWSFKERELEIEFSEAGKICTLTVEADNPVEENSFNIEELWIVDGLLTWLRGQ
jgi:hypothetical protein